MALSSGGEGLRSSPYRTVLRAAGANRSSIFSGTSGPPHALPSTMQLILGHLEPFRPKYLCCQPNSPLTQAGAGFPERGHRKEPAPRRAAPNSPWRLGTYSEKARRPLSRAGCNNKHTSCISARLATKALNHSGRTSSPIRFIAHDAEHEQRGDERPR